MSKVPNATSVKNFVHDIHSILDTKLTKKFPSLVVDEYPFDSQLLALSPLYRTSRKFYNKLGGTYRARACSTMRSLSATDLFKDEIEYSPTLTELEWFKDHHQEVFDAHVLMDSLIAFNGISLFHEQNHRIMWRLLPRAPKDPHAFLRYLNFTESLIITLDLVLGDEVGGKLSPALTRMKAIYRPSGGRATGKAEMRSSLLAVLYVTYLVLELVDRRDIPKCLEYVFPKQKMLNKQALKRGFELSELFTVNTNREWQRRYWRQAQVSLAKVQKALPPETLDIPEDPLDFDEEFALANYIFDFFGV